MIWLPSGLLDLAASAAHDDEPVLLLGESGVGKDTLARRIHELSPRREQPWRAVDGAGMPGPVLLNLMFGDAADPGVVAQARGGSLFIGNIGELSVDDQSALADLARHGAFEDVRLMGDTNRDVNSEVERGCLLPDFLQLFAGRVIHIPPLRQRPSEILPYARAFITELATEMKRSIPEMSPEVARALESYGWSSNVRSLWCVIARALILCPSNRIDPEHLGLRL
jgi:DNA-binding NtrC family response regulator